MGIFFGAFKLVFGAIAGLKFYMGIGAVLFGLWKGIAWWNGWKRARAEARKEERMVKAVTIQQNDAQRIIKVEKMLSPGTIEVKDETGKITTFKSKKSKKVYKKAVSKGESDQAAKEKAMMAAIEEFKKYVQDIGTPEETKKEEDE